MPAADAILRFTPSDSPPRARLAVFWGITGALGAVAVLPYAMALTPALFARIPVALPVFVAAQFAQACVMLFLLSWIGLRLGPALGLDAPLTRALVYRTKLPVPWRTLASACLAGALAGAAVLGLDRLLAPLMPPAALAAPGSIAFWKRFLACFYGGMTEELLARLFVMTTIVWAVHHIAATKKKKKSPPGSATIAIGVLGAAILFGLGHLPAAAEVWPLTRMVVARTVLLNAVAGITFGVLYWRRGLEHAMCAHFCADILVHLIGPG